MSTRPALRTSPVVQPAKPLDAHGMAEPRAGRVLYGAERQRVIDEHIAWLERREASELETEGSPIQEFLDGRLSVKCGTPLKIFRG